MDFGGFDYGGDGGYQPGEPGYDTSGSTPGFDINDPTLGATDQNSGMIVDPSTGDVYDKDGNFVGNMNDSQFGGPGMTMGGGGGGNSSSSALSALMKLLGGGSSLLPLLGAAGIGLGSYLQGKATNKATGQMTDAVKQANDAITKILGGQSAAYQPYADMGKAATERLTALGPSNIAANFSPLASKFGPLGNGRGIGGPTTFSGLMNKGG